MMKKSRVSKLFATGLVLLLTLSFVLPLNVFALAEEKSIASSTTEPVPGNDIPGASSVVTPPEEENASSVSVVPPSSISEYTISFYNSDVLVEQQTVKEAGYVSKPATEPAAPEGMRFVGWFEKDASDAFVFSGRAVTNDIDLHAVFEAEETDTQANKPADDTAAGSLVGKARSLAQQVAANQTCTVTFMVDGAMLTTATVEKETLVALPTPTSKISNAPFLGWYLDGENAPFSAHRLVEDDITLTAKFSENVLVTYLDANGSELDVFEVEKGQPTPKTSKTPTLSMGQQFQYWTLAGDNTEYNFDNSTVTHSIRLVPKFNSRALAVFSTQGSEIEPQTGVDGFKATIPETDPTRNGYIFEGWASDENGNDPFDFATPIEGTVFIYAKWKADKVNYTLSYWVEKANTDAADPSNEANRSGYDLVYTKEMAGAATAGETLKLDAAQAAEQAKSGGASVTDLLCYSTFVYSEEKTVSGSGNTVINVFYKRTEFTFNFDVTKELDSRASYSVAGTRSLDGEIFLGDGTSVGSQYSITVKLGQDISKLWPRSVTFSGTTEVFRTWSSFYGNNVSTNLSYMYLSVAFSAPRAVQSNFYYTISAPQRHEVTLYPTLVSNPYKETRHYYTEITEEERAKMDASEYVALTTSNASYPGTRYYKLTLISVTNNQSSNPSTSAKNWPGTTIEGFEAIGTSTSANLCQTAQFQKVIQDPNGVKDKDYIIQYFMPRKSNTLTLVTNGGVIQNPDARLSQSGAYYTAKLPYQTAISALLPDDDGIKKTNYAFAGWYTDELFNIEYAGGFMPESGLTLYAKFIGTEVSVRYTDGADVITNTYARNDKMTQHDLAGTIYNGVNVGDVVPGKGVFQGWYYEVGGTTKATVKFPLGLTLTRDEYILTADFTPTGYTVTFKGDMGGSALITYAKRLVKSGSDNTMARSGHLDVTPPARPGHVFKGWSITEGGTTPNFTMATRVLEDTTVYAVWEINQINVSFNGNGGTTTPGLLFYTVNYGQSLDTVGLALPGSDAVTRSGYRFTGWFTHADGGLLFDTNTKLTKDRVLYARWEEVGSSTSNTSSSTSNSSSSISGTNEGSTETSSSITSSSSVVVPVTGTATTPESVPPVPQGTNTPATAETQPESSSIAPRATIVSDDTPLQGLAANRENWSLLSLLIAVAGGISSILVAVTLFTRRKEEKPQAENNTQKKTYTTSKTRKLTTLLKTIAIVFGLLAGILFLLLNNLALPMVLVNQWTLWVAVAFLIHLLAITAQLLRRKQTNKEKQAQ